MLAESKSVYALDLQQYYEQNVNKTFHDKDEFLQNFPYSDYLNSVGFTDFNALQKDRYFLWTKFRDGDEFLYRLAESYLKVNPVGSSPGELSQKIDIGEEYLKTQKGFRREVNEIYLIIGYFILSKVAEKISRDISHGRYDERDPARAAIIQRLAKDKVFITREEGPLSKFITSLKNFDFRYLWQRAHSYALTYRKLVWELSLPSLLLASILIWAGGRTRKGWLKFGGAMYLICSAVALALLLSNPPGAPAAQASAHTNLQLIADRNFYPVNNGNGYAVQVFKLLHSGKEIGQVIWLDRQEIQASYLAYENVPARFNDFKNSHQIILAASGGYTNAERQPEGFTTEDGNIVNPVIMPDRDGLVMLSEGGINVLNMRNDTFQLYKGPVISNPFNSLLSYARLLESCKVRHATLFQTHLLAYSDTLVIDRKKAPPEARERRILVLARDRKDQHLYHIIFNVTSQYNLADIAAEIFGLIQTHNMKVEAILNLDVGKYNILSVYDEKGNPLQDIKGTVDVNQSTNLLVYTR